jgi:diguanylate cyclase (GGDEF)-like protein
MRRWILDSRVGLRMLGLFALAAGAPMLLLAWLSQQAVDDNFARSEALVVANTAKSTSRQTLERLRLAGQALLVDPIRGRTAEQRGAPSPLLAVVDVDAQGRTTVVHGRASDAGPLTSLAAEARVATGRRLLLTQPTSSDARSGVVLAVARQDLMRLGLVDPRFLWDGFDEMPPGHWQCVFGSDAPAPLFCSEPGAAEGATRRLRSGEAGNDGTTPSVKGLFLGADFGAPDWYFVAGVAADGSGDAEGGALRHAAPVAAVAALLLAVLLALVQLRRTMGPLVRLTAGAREIAQRRFGTVVNIRSGDEFGELAAAFNDMSRRLQAQFDELGGLAEIDRAIVSRTPLAGIHATIATQMQHLLPGRSVLVARFTGSEDGQGADLVIRFATGTAVERSTRVDAAARARVQAADDWSAFDDLVVVPEFAVQRGALALPLRWGEHCFGFIAIDAGPLGSVDADTLRQIAELRNRAAIAASADEHERVLRRAARLDGVTSLLNRNGLYEELTRLAAAAGPGPGALAVLYIDMDRFKSINDTLGHAAGDQALRAVAERLRGCLPSHGVAARPAGDEFVMLLPGAAGDAAAALAQAVCDTLALPIVLAETVFFLRASVGIALCTDTQTTPEQVLRSADQAMYLAKRRGGGRYVLFDAQIDAQTQRRAWIEAELPRAAERGQLRLLYQPRIDRRSGRMTSVEALIRWQHPQRGLCAPAEFIPVAEESELIEHLGRWVLDTACAQVRRWHRHDIGLRVAINLSARQIASDRLLRDLRAALARHGVTPQDLEFEITEGLLLDPTDATVARLRKLRDLGITIALDDFGTGYSSMSYLRSLPLDVLKIDRAFVKDLGRDRSAMAIARAIVALASSLGLRTVAEGVEDATQWQALAGLGCDEVQGYLVSRPVEGGQIETLFHQPSVWFESGTVPLGKVT